MSTYFDCDPIRYEGPDSRNPLAFKHYDPEAEIAGKTMKEHLRFAGAYWHVMRNDLSDPVGAGTAHMPWDDGSDTVENALTRVDVFFEFLAKMGIDYYCWHDRDIAPEGTSFSDSTAMFHTMVDEAAVVALDSFLRTEPPPGQPRLEGADAMHAWVRAWCGQEIGRKFRSC